MAGHVGWQALTQHWVGSSWEQFETPFSIPHTSGALLYSVVAIASDDVWAGGLWPAPTGSGIDALVMHWDGSRWEVVPTPRVDYGQEIQGMAARGPNDIWAVGGSGTNRNDSYVIFSHALEFDLRAEIPAGDRPAGGRDSAAGESKGKRNTRESDGFSRRTVH